jgi:cytochrome c2
LTAKAALFILPQAFQGAFIIDAVTRNPAAASARAPSRAGLLTILQLLCAAGLALGVATLLPSSLRSLSVDMRDIAWLLGGGYVVCAGLLVWREWRGRYVGIDTLISSLVVGFAPALIFAWHAHGTVPNRVILPELLYGGALAAVTVALRGRPRIRAALLAALALAGLVLPFSGINKPHTLPSVRSWRVNSALYPLKVTEYRTLIKPSPATGGAVAAFRDRFVVANGAGDIFLVSKSPTTGALTAQHLKRPVPINWHDFAATFGQQEDLGYFRTADLLAQDLGEKTRLFATHHFWKAQEKCFVERVSMLELDTERFLQANDENAAWRTIFESTPCIRLDATDPLGSLAHFGGIQSGGRLALLSPNELLLAVGDHTRDGVNSPEVFSQDSTSSYGKTILLNLADFSSHAFSIGHRNPQGLYADGPGAIWLTEHGPQGGDELNLVQRGANYGWPLATYGTQYGAHFWPGNAVPGSHGGFTEPFYSWVPSIGVSSLLVMHGAQFKLWDQDLMVASLKDGALYRARVRDSRIVMLERIPFGRRIRDIAEGSAGQLLMWSDRGALLEIEADRDVGTGEALFRACSGCHMIGEGDANGIGPDLRRIVNRPVAAAVGFRYSPAMQQLGGRWDRARLDRFLANPQVYVPGTKMKSAGVPDPGERKELIEFLVSGANNKPPPEDPLPD